MQKWYNGYKFGNTGQIYNPWSIVNYISRHEEGFKAYWINTGTDSLIKSRIVEPDLNRTYDTLQRLIAGQTIEKRIVDSFVFADFDTKGSRNNNLPIYSRSFARWRPRHFVCGVDCCQASP